MMDSTLPWGLLQGVAVGAVSDQKPNAVTTVLLEERVKPPDWFIGRALKIPRDHAKVEEKPGSLPRLMAQLLFDGGRRPQLAGTRGAANARRLTYATASLTAHLEARDDTNGSVTLSGQLLSAAPPSRYSVGLTGSDGGQVDAAALTNTFGYFSIQGIPSSTYTLVVYTDAEEIEITGLSL